MPLSGAVSHAWEMRWSCMLMRKTQHHPPRRKTPSTKWMPGLVGFQRPVNRTGGKRLHSRSAIEKVNLPQYF
jgi:hypothetical protein